VSHIYNLLSINALQSAKVNSTKAADAAEKSLKFEINYRCF